jgi:hypothetical protein
VWRKVILEAEVQRKSPFVLNASYLKEEVVKELIHREWNGHPTLRFFGKL